MVYLGLACGAGGLLPYCYHVYTKYDPAKKAAGGWPWVLGGYLPDKQPALWQSLARIGGELEKLAPALERPGRMWVEKEVYLREIPPAEASPGYLIAVNPSEQAPAEAVAKLQTQLLASTLKGFAGGTDGKVVGGEVHLRLAPMQVGIYVLPAK
jgi:hypothetical protein